MDEITIIDLRMASIKVDKETVETVKSLDRSLCSEGRPIEVICDVRDFLDNTHKYNDIGMKASAKVIDAIQGNSRKYDAVHLYRQAESSDMKQSQG